ncbi:UNVERIFIED_CONTAM: hypothetical protein K2H54_058945 [Gekko kuhli]
MEEKEKYITVKSFKRQTAHSDPTPLDCLGSHRSLGIVAWRRFGGDDQPRERTRSNGLGRSLKRKKKKEK